MTDRIDEMFENDLSKLSMPSELAMNAAKVKAAQTDKPGAEKPDLYAKGKGVGKGGKPAKDEENDERKSKGPNKGEKKDPNAPDKQQGAKSKDDMDKESSAMVHVPKKGMSKLKKGLIAAGAVGATGLGVAGAKKVMDKRKDGEKTASDDDERAYTSTIYYKKRFLRPGMKETRRTIAIRGKIPAKAPVPEPMMKEKNANLDDEFNADMRQIVGAEPMDKQASWERPDVSVPGQTTDRIDDHFIGWMKEKADEDVVVMDKEAQERKSITTGSGAAYGALGGALGGGTAGAVTGKGLKGRLRNALIGAGAGALGGAGLGAGLGKASDDAYKEGKKSGDKKMKKKAELDKEASCGAKHVPGKKCEKCGETMKKEAGVQQNPENLDLLARIRKSAEEKYSGGLVAGSGDV